MTIPEILDGNGPKRCDLLKMDCEGAEYDILYHCPSEVLTRIDRIALEVHGGPGDQNIDALDAPLGKADSSPDNGRWGCCPPGAGRREMVEKALSFRGHDRKK